MFVTQISDFAKPIRNADRDPAPRLRVGQSPRGVTVRGEEPAALRWTIKPIAGMVEQREPQAGASPRVDDKLHRGIAQIAEVHQEGNRSFT